MTLRYPTALLRKKEGSVSGHISTAAAEHAQSERAQHTAQTLIYSTECINPINPTLSN